MRAYPLLLHSSYPLFLQATATPHFPSPFFFTSSANKNASQSLSTVSPPKFLLFRSRAPTPTNCANRDFTALDSNDDDYDYDNYDLLEGKTESLSEDGVFIEIEKLGRNSRRIQSKIEIDANLDNVWNILTDYEKLVDFIPGLAVSELVEKKDNFARLYQIGQQNLPFGLKFNAKAVLDCYEKDLEIFPHGKKRDIEFKMIEGDFQLFEGKWSLEQFNRGNCQDSDSALAQGSQTTLSYILNVQPKIWLPVGLIEGRISKEIKINLSSIREAAQKLINKALHPR